MIIGDRLKELRKDRNITQDDLAEALGVRRSTVSAWENEVSAPSDELKVELAKFFNISLDYLMGLTNREVTYMKDNYIILPPDFSPEMKQEALIIMDFIKCKYGSKK